MGLSTSIWTSDDSLSEEMSSLDSERLRFAGDDVGVYLPEVADANASRNISFAQG